MSNTLQTYSGKDVQVSITGPLSGNIGAGGIAELGLAQITVRMSVTRAVLQVAMDGAVVPSYIPGDQGEIELQVWQTSILQQALTAWHAQVIAAANIGDVTNAFGSSVLIQSILDGSTHTGTGCTPQKFPDKTYAEQAGRVTWVVMCANLVNL